jgi:hypothetical protein
MPQATFDPSSKWLLEEHGAAILYLAGVRSVLSCKARKAEVVQPRKLPDGLLEVQFTRKQTGLVLVEVATYPEERVVTQMADDVRLVRQARGTLPEALIVVLREKGNYRVPSSVETSSELGWTREQLSWKVIEVWTLDAQELLEAPDIGIIPWVPLARHEGAPEVLLQRCRDRIDREGGRQRANLLAVTQVFARVKYDRPHWLDILGGSRAMIESPLIQEIVAESRRDERVNDIILVLESRFEEVHANIPAGLAQVKDPEGLKRLVRSAARCKNLAEFEEALQAELPAPPPISTRRRKKPGKSAE